MTLKRFSILAAAIVVITITAVLLIQHFTTSKQVYDGVLVYQNQNGYEQMKA